MMMRIAAQRGPVAPTKLLLERSNRTFFASSTDHTRLLQDAEVHYFEDGATRQYVLAAGGMGVDMVQKVPQLHLARIFLKDNTIYGAKVVNKTLGDIPTVCERLLDAAIKDGGKEAKSTLHGLSDWVLKEKLSTFDEAQGKVVSDIAHGNLNNYDDSLWEPLALEFYPQAEEVQLYIAKEGAKLIRIEHQADTSEYANTSAGAMALFKL